MTKTAIPESQTPSTTAAAALLLTPSDVPGFQPPPQEPSRSNEGVELRFLLGESTGNRVTMMFGTVAPGREISRETHADWSETLFVLAGTATCQVGDAEPPTRVGPRQGWHVRKGHPHVVRNDETIPLEFVILFGV